MAPLVTAEELSLVLDEEISAERFAALYRTGLNVVASGYNGDPEEATGWAASVVAGVLSGVLVRITSNPKGTRQLNAGGAGITFGGADETIATVFSLTSSERQALESVSPLPVVGASGSRAFTIRPGAA